MKRIILFLLSLSLTIGYAQTTRWVKIPMGKKYISPYASWDANKKGANITISGTYSTVATTVGTGMVLSNIGKSAGKWFWEITFTTTLEAANIGISTATGTYTIELGFAATAYSIVRFDANNQEKENNNTFAVFANTVPRLASGQVIDVALDMDVGEIRIYKDGTLQNSTFMFNGLSGTFYAAVSQRGVGNKGLVYTANFGQNPFTYTPTTLGLTGYPDATNHGGLY